MSEQKEYKGLGIVEEAKTEDNIEPEAVTHELDLGGLDFVIEDDGSDDDGVDKDGLTPDERLRSFSDTILSTLVVEDSEIKSFAVNRLFANVTPMLFRDENYIIYSVLYNYRNRLKRMEIDEEFISLYLNRNRDIITKAKPYIDIRAFGEVDGSLELGYISGVLKQWRRLKGMPIISEGDFELSLEKYILEFKAIESSKAYEVANVILNRGMYVNGKNLFGFNDSFNYVRRKIAEIEGVTTSDKGTGFTKMRTVLGEEREDGKKPYKISDFDTLDELNKHYGGIYTGLFYQVIAPPKAGKSKLCCRICHTTAIRYGNNVTVWAAEGGKEMWTAQMRAIHFDWTFNQGVSVTEKKYGVDQNVILHDKFQTDELRDCEMTSKLDLMTNEGYGSIDYIDRPFNVETFIEDIDTSVKENNSQLVIIDYLQLIGSEKDLDERRRIAEAYKVLLAYCHRENVAVLTPAQYKQSTFDELIKSTDVGNFDLRTAGGGSAEVLRTPDISFALWATTADLANNRMKILSMPCRLGKAYPKIDVIHDLGSCKFLSVDGGGTVG